MGVDKPNYTQIPNLLLDDLMMYMGEAELKVTMAIARQTFGYHREKVKLSLSKLQELTGLSRPTVVKGINEGVKRGTIERKESGDSFTFGLAINEDTVGSKEFLLVKNIDQASKESLPEVVKNVYSDTPTLKKVLKKDIKEKGESAPALASPEPTNKTLRHKSPHLDARHFVNGHIPPGTGINAVEVYYERFSINQDAARLNAIKEDDLARLCPDLDKLRDVVTAYSRTAFQPGNLQLILDWYNTGIPDKNKVPGQARNGALDEDKKAALRTAASLARKEIEMAQKFKTPVNPAWQQTIEKAKGLGVI